MARIRWIRVLVMAVALEAVLFATLVPLISRLSWGWLMVAIATGCAVFAYISGRLVARGLTSGAALHGLLVGVLATAIYVALNAIQPGGVGAAVAFYGAPLYVAINGLRIVGCVAGAVHQGRGVRPAPAAV